jgi:hypothetical protein
MKRVCNFAFPVSAASISGALSNGLVNAAVSTLNVYWGEFWKRYTKKGYWRSG